jgi:1-acyl-sn-glycerol-3-phosphate acyltransferase
MNGWSAVRRPWRAAASGLCFLVFGAGALALSLTAFPLLSLTAADAATARLRVQRTIRAGCACFAALMKALGLVRWEVHGGEALAAAPDAGGRLIIANHPSLIDAVFLLAWLPQADCIVKQALLENPFLRHAVRRAGYLGNAEPDALVAECAAALRAGRTLLVFPEGTRSVPGRPLRLRRGAARIALAAGVPVVPVQIRCEPLVLSKRMRWYQMGDRPAHFRFDVLAPLPPPRRRAGESEALAARRLTRTFERLLAVEPPAAPAPWASYALP